MNQNETPTPTEKPASVSKVHLRSDRRRTNGFGVYNNKRKSISIKIDPVLYAEFIPIAQKLFGSVCCAVEAYMASIIGVGTKSKVHLGNTVVINDLHIHRNLRERRRLDPAVYEAIGEERRASDARKVEVKAYAGEVLVHIGDWDKRISTVFDALSTLNVPDDFVAEVKEAVLLQYEKEVRSRLL
ncbi:MAG: hypothetical protein NWE89_06480 [Candidatus Bathyarchaeota archaeon]|nr:hypothetical protein [Candidatus Bathyarchaeota archaeon]